MADCSAITRHGHARLSSEIPALVNLFLPLRHSEVWLLSVASSANPATVISGPQSLSGEEFSARARAGRDRACLFDRCARWSH
jgi:hypothetical protein